MNILFNKKILFSLLLSSSLLIQGAYAEEDGPSAMVYGTLNVTTNSSCNTTNLQVLTDGSVTVGDAILTNGTGVLHIEDTENNSTADSHSTVSNIQKTLTVNIDGNVLNEETINCNGTGSEEAKRAKVTNNKGLLINQGYINVGQYATLICNKFPGDSTAQNSYDLSWYDGSSFITNHNNYGGIMNGYCPFDKANDVANVKVKTFYYDATNYAIKVDENITTIDARKKKTGTITFIPGAICNNGDQAGGAGNEGPGEINGGYIDLTKYVKIQTNNTASNNDANPNAIDSYSLQFAKNEDGYTYITTYNNSVILKIKLKNAEIKLFTDNKITNSSNYTVNKQELSQLTLQSLDSTSTMINMFANLTFENCRCEIPDDDGNVGAEYKVNGYKYVSPAYEASKSDFDISDVKGDNPTATNTDNQLIIFDSDKRNKIITDGSGGSSNFDVVKRLFANGSNICTSPIDTDPLHKKIYHEIGKRTPGENNKYKVWISNDSNTYINGGSPTTQPEDGLVLYSKNGGQDGTKATFSYLFNTYMALNCYIDTAEATTAYSDTVSPLPLKLKPTSTSGDTISSDIFIQTSGSKPIQIDKQYTDGSNTDQNINKPLELVMKNPWIHTGANPTYTGTLSRDLPSSPSDAQRTTRIVQEYDGPAFSNFKINSNVIGTDASNTKKNQLTSSDILEYEVVPNNSSSYTHFSAHNPIDSTKPLVADTFTIGIADATATFTVDSSTGGTDSSNILTQNFTVNKNATYTLTGHISVRNLKGDDL